MTPEMGRRKTLHPDLPPRMTARSRKKLGGFNYYYGQKKKPLGADFVEACRQWAILEKGSLPNSVRYVDVADRWEREAIHKGRRRARSPKTQTEFRRGLKELRDAFKGALFDQIKPKHVRQYLDRRTAKVAGNREIAVLSIIWNWARAKGITDLANPCTGIDRNPESARTVYVTDEQFQEVYSRGTLVLQDTMDLLRCTSHSPSDILGLKRPASLAEPLWVRRGKTGKLVRFRIEGTLKNVLERILARPRAVSSLYLIADERGQPVNLDRLEKLFGKARGDSTWQLRDIRAKAITDEPDLRTASQRAGHANEQITAEVYRRIKGDLVSPLN
jgi:integrase